MPGKIKNLFTMLERVERERERDREKREGGERKREQQNL